MNVETLQRELLALRLVEQGQIDEVTAKLRTPHTVDSLLHALEATEAITPFISGKLKKGETEGLVMGDYKLMYRNASGSFARVYRAKSLKDGSMHGLKVLRQRWAEDPGCVDQFHKEAELGKRLRHPNIAPIFEIGVTGTYHWFSMEFVEGGNLRDFINIRGRIDPPECTKFMLGMARGLEYALGMGFTHRDLKMTNVLMSSRGAVKLIDFGLAGQGTGIVDSEQSRAIEYAAIEKATNAPANDPRSDLYFLGAIFYELVSGEPPYARTRDRDTRANIARYRNVRPIRQVAPDLPLRVVDIVERLMQVDPSRRFQRPGELAAECEATLRDMGEEVPSEGAGNAVVGRGTDDKPTVLCVEDRAKHLDKLRDYFTKHGYRVLAISDVNRALERLDRNPPDCLVLMGGSIGEGIVQAYNRAVARAANAGTAVVAVLSDKQGDYASQLKPTDAHPVLARVATLRDLRSAIDAALAALAARNGSKP